MQADYVIVGSGSAGSAMAARLSEAGASVLVLEYGGTDAGPLIQMPGALSYPMNMPRYDWGFVTEPEPHLGGRRLACPRGKVIGGSSSINGMVYVRGHARDFDHWAEAGADGWAFADVAPYFERLECWHGPETHPGGDPGWRGTAGPLHVTRGRHENPLNAAFIEAGRQAGFELTPDYNGAKQEGFGPMEMTVWRGRRWSAASAYLKPALRRQNCDARPLPRPPGRHRGRPRDRRRDRARRQRIEIVRAEREVILAASSINSPKLLMLSGIGPAAHLAEHKVPLVADRPGRRAEPAGPPRALHPAGLDPAGHALSLLEPARKGLGRAAMAAAEGRARRVEPVPGLRLPALGRGRRVPRHPVPFPADRRAL